MIVILDSHLIFKRADKKRAAILLSHSFLISCCLISLLLLFVKIRKSSQFLFYLFIYTCEFELLFQFILFYDCSILTTSNTKYINTYECLYVVQRIQLVFFTSWLIYVCIRRQTTTMREREGKKEPVGLHFVTHE